ncbi:MAG: hypothetical protein FIA95_11980 [Gemmatimonadetes bacterium]|nr:hypothetical protein [Gemmatimonadota bacterium]
MVRHQTILLGLLGGALFLPLPVLAQGQATNAPPQAQGQQPPAPQPPELVFEREVFTYPRLQRRNPFRALSGVSQGAPRFEELRVVGIIYSDRPSESVAVLGTSTVEYSEDASTATVQPGVSWYLKVGQSVGNIRVVAIRREQVVVDVEEFGITEQKIMQLQTRRLGGTP